MRAAAVFRAPATPEQARRLAQGIRDARPRRPAGVLEVRLYFADGVATLVSLWVDRATLEAYLRTADVPRGTELMRAVGLEPAVRIADVLEAD